jgi:hypothetical protein
MPPGVGEVVFIYKIWRDTMITKTTEIRLRVSVEELDALRDSLEHTAQELSEELAECMDNESSTQIIEVAGRLRATQAARCKIDIQA